MLVKRMDHELAASKQKNEMEKKNGIKEDYIELHSQLKKVIPKI